jgi:hypothetical protein
MGSFKINPLVGQADFLRRQVLATEKEIDTRVISLSTRDKLFHSLESNQRVMEQLQKKATTVDEFAQAQIQDKLEGLDQRIVALYGRIQNLAVDQEVADIAREAQHLESTLKQGGNHQKIAKEVSHLKEHIQTLTNDHALGREERHTIATVRATIRRADSFLRTNGLREDTSHLFNQFNLLDLAASEQEPLSDGEIDVIELFEVAECLFREKDKEGLRRFNQLSEEAKRRFHAHLRRLGESTGNPLANRIKTAQALIAAAYDLADSHDGEPYLAEVELNKLFDSARSFG